MFGSEQEREQWDYEMGMGTDLQNAYSISQMERKPDDRAAADELVSLGRYVLVTDYPIYCPRTDALMGVHRAMLGDFETHDEGVAALNARCVDSDPDERVHLLYNYTPPVAVVPLDPTEIPF